MNSADKKWAKAVDRRALARATRALDCQECRYTIDGPPDLRPGPPTLYATRDGRALLVVTTSTPSQRRRARARARERLSTPVV